MSGTQIWLQSMSFRELLEEELWWRNHRVTYINEWSVAETCDATISILQAEINRRIQKG